jgi:ubiquinone/menaquinone biosynthesis C-methylase UbiE
MSQSASHDLEFSGKYDAAHAREYFYKHEREFWRRLSNWRDHQIARRALAMAGNPRSVLDLPCGTGRFWDVLTEDSIRTVHAADYSQNMIDVGLELRPPEVAGRVHAFQASAFDVPVADGFVENVFCIRFMHHLGETGDRLAVLRELRRVTSDTVILSLWVDGNLKAWSRRRQEARRRKHRYQNRFVIPSTVIEGEFRATGFDIVGHVDFMPRFAMWRTYVLRKSVA